MIKMINFILFLIIQIIIVMILFYLFSDEHLDKVQEKMIKKIIRDILEGKL